jgi:hypothetical protein
MQALFVNMDTYLQGLFSLANDPAAEVRKLVKEFAQQQSISLLVMLFCSSIYTIWIVQGELGFYTVFFI